MKKETFNVAKETRSDKLQKKHDEVKENTKHDCKKPCAVCNLFCPGQRYIEYRSREKKGS